MSDDARTQRMLNAADTVTDGLRTLFAATDGDEAEVGEILDSCFRAARLSWAGDRPCIKRSFHGGTQTISFREFADEVVQDGASALEIARTMLEHPARVYHYNANEAEFYETFEILADGEKHLREQVASYQEDSP